MKVPKRSYFLALFLLLCSICQLQASKVFELKVIDQNYVMIHFKDGDALYVDDGVGPGSLREYNYDDLDNNYIVRYRDPLAVNNLNVAANWLISSTDDGNYSTSGIAPLSVARKTKYNGTEQVVFSNGWQHDYTTEHYVILQMPSPLQQGNSYTINLPGNIEADANQISFTYNYLSSRSDAIHINTVGYPSLSSIKSADLYYWLGDAGPRDYASFEGNRVFLVNIANEVATEVGTVQFWRNSSTEYDGHDFIQSPVWNVDFTGFNTPGSYRLAVEGVGCSDEFEIRSDIYFEPFKVSTQGYYFMRVGQAANANPNSPCVPRQPLFNVNQNSPAGIRVVRTSFGPSHPNWSDNWDQVQFPDTWAQYVLPNSENPNAFGGHSDARDWDRHLNHAISAWDMLLPYILTDGALSDDDLGIAESGNGVPDIIDEAREQVDFFFRLRDENGGFAWGLSNPNNGIGANGVIYQTWATAYAAWANAANCAMLGQAYQIAGQNTLTTDYTNKAIEAWNQAESYTDEQLDFIWDFGLAHLKGRDLKFMAAAYLYNLTGNSSYEQVIVNESVISGPSQDIMQLGTSGNTGGPGFNQLWGTVGYLVADRPYNNRSIGNQTLYNQMQSSLIWSAQQFEQGESNNRASRRPNFGPYSLYPTTTHLNRTIAAHAFATNSSVKRDLLDALLLEADYTLGRNASNHIQMTTASTSLQTNRSIEVVYTTGSDDGAPGFHPGHTPYADYDVFGGGQEGDVSLLLNSCYPSSGNWPVGELFFNSAHFFPHTEFTPQQTMRGKQALYGYLYGISGGRTPLAATYKLEVDNGSGSGFYAPGATVSISAAAPPIGHIFQEWVSNNAYIDDYYLADATDPNTSVTMPERGHLYLKATYQIPPPAQYQLTVNNGLGAGTYEAGEEVTLIANTPNPGLRFSNWTGAVNNISYPSDGQNKAAIKIIMPAQDISMTANYESGQQSYTVCGSLENAGFEEAWFGWNPSNATLSSDARSGDWAALGFSRAGVFAKFDVDPGSFSTVELKMWVKTIGDSGFSSFGLDFLDSGGNVMQAEKLEIPHGTTTGWEEFTGSKTIPPNTASINIWVYADNGQILYDDACLIFDGGSGPTCSNVTNAGSINYSGQTTVAASSYDPPNISNSSTASGGAGGSIVYRWQQRENGGSWSTISGATGSSYNPPSITSSTDFRRQAQRDCQSSWVSSNVISITLSTPPGCENVTSAGSINYGGQTNVAANSFDPPNISNGSAASGGTGGSIVYRWQQRENGGSWSTLNGVTGSSYNPPSISTSTDFRRQAQRDCQISWISSNLISIALTPPGGGSDLIVHARGTTGEEVISLQIDGVTVSSWTITTSLADYVYPNYSGGTSTPIQVLFDNDGLSSNNVDKNFFLDYIIIDGTTYQTETNAERLPVGACGDDQWLWCNGYFEFFGGVQPPTCENASDAGSINYSGQTNVTANSYDPPNISSGSVASGGTGGSIVYRWQQRENGGSWSTIGSATGSSYNPPSITSSTDFRRQAQRDCQSSWVSSNLISITLTAPQSCANVTSAGSINYAGQTNVTANSFDPPNISNGSAANGGTGGSIVYRWQQRENGGSWSTISGATGSSYNPPSISTSTDFRRQAQRDCQSSWIRSNLISIALTPPGGGSDLIVHARGTTGEEVISLQIDGVTVTSWTITTSLADYVYPNYSGGTGTPIQVLFDNDGLSSNNVDKNFFLDYIIVDGTTYQTETNAERLPLGACGDDQWLWCNGYFEFFGGVQPPTCDNVSDAGSINYSGQTNVTANTYDPPNISNGSAASGGTGGSIVYRWQQRENGGSWSIISGATGSSYNPPSIISSTDFRRQAQRDCQSSWVSSNLISITLTAPPSCANVTSAGSSNYAGQTNVTANSFDPPNISNGSAASGGTGGSIAYRWQQRENGGSWSTISGATGSSYNPPSISTSTDFRRQAQRDCQSSWISSNVIVISLTPPPSGSDLVVNAYGTTGEEVIELQIDGVTVTSWTLTTSPADYTYSNYSGGTSSPIQVAFNNDGLSSGNVDKNVFVDYIEITGTVYQTETNAERLPVGACGDDQWLWCNGYFEFFGNSSSRPANLSTGLGYVPNLNVYPNPVVDNYFTVLIEDFREEHLLEIFDLEGRKLLERRLSASNTTLRPNLGDGTYIVQISNAHGFTAYRLLISNR